MNNFAQYLSKRIFSKNVEYAATRDGFGDGLVLCGQKDERVVAICADLTESTRMEAFSKKFPERFIEVGVAEQLMVTLASGMANYGKIPFIASYAVFSPGRNLEQIRTTVALNNVPVKIIGAHAGISVGPDGATHQALEDIAIMRTMPNMIVIVPCDALEAKKATLEAAFNKKPTYIRLTREKSPIITTQNSPFMIGKAEIFVAGHDVTLIACGPLLYETLMAARDLKKEGIGAEVINCNTIKPLDEKTILDSVKKTQAVVSIEEHQIIGGLGGALSELFSQKFPVPQEYIGVHDCFGESGTPQELQKKFGLTVFDIIESAEKVLRRKTS